MADAAAQLNFWVITLLFFYFLCFALFEFFKRYYYYLFHVCRIIIIIIMGLFSAPDDFCFGDFVVRNIFLPTLYGDGITINIVPATKCQLPHLLYFPIDSSR